MAIHFHCLGCGKHFQVDDQKAGKRARCKQCGTEMKVPGKAQAASARTPRPSPPNAVLDDRPAPARPGRPRHTPEFDEGRAPARLGSPQPAKAKRKRAREISPIIQGFLGLLGALGVLTAVTAFFVGGISLAMGHTQVAILAFSILGFFVSIGLCVVAGLKLVLLAREEDPGLTTAAFFLGGTVLAPLILSGWIARRWEETRGLVFAHGAGIVGTVFFSLFVSFYATSVFKRQTPGEATWHTPDSPVIIVVTDVPPNGGAEIIGEKIKLLADPGRMYSLDSDRTTGRTVSYTLRPVRDPKAFAKRIAFGTVKVISGRKIWVAATPISVEEREAFREAHPDLNLGGPPAPSAATQRQRGPMLDPDALAEALHDLGSRESPLRRMAARTLACATPTDDRREEVQRALRPLLDEADIFVVKETLAAMVAWRTGDTVPMLVEKLRVTRTIVRWQVIEALGQLRDPRAAKALAGRLKDDELRVRIALQRIGPAAEPSVLALLQDSNPDVRRKACELLADLGGHETLIYMMDARPELDPDPSVRAAGMQARSEIIARVGMPPSPRDAASKNIRRKKSSANASPSR